MPYLFPHARRLVLPALLIACTPNGEGTGDGTPVDQVPTVFADETYTVDVTIGEVYAEGLTHSDWNTPNPTSMDLLLDIYAPLDAEGNRPAVLLIHGGGFTGGSRDKPELVATGQYLASRGFLCMSIDYRVAGDHGTLPEPWLDASYELKAPADTQDQMRALYAAGRDAKAAVRWLHANAASLGVDPQYITVLGSSAGAIQTMMLGVTEPEDYRDELDQTADPTLSTTHLDQPSDVHTLVDLWGGGAQIDILSELYGLDRWDATDPPVAIVHGTADETVPFTEAEAIRDAYLETGATFSFHPLKGAGHGPWGSEVDGLSIPAFAFEFIVEQQGLVVE